MCSSRISEQRRRSSLRRWRGEFQCSRALEISNWECTLTGQTLNFPQRNFELLITSRWIFHRGWLKMASLCFHPAPPHPRHSPPIFITLCECLLCCCMCISLGRFECCRKAMFCSFGLLVVFLVHLMVEMQCFPKTGNEHLETFCYCTVGQRLLL